MTGILWIPEISSFPEAVGALHVLEQGCGRRSIAEAAEVLNSFWLTSQVMVSQGHCRQSSLSFSLTTTLYID